MANKKKARKTKAGKGIGRTLLGIFMHVWLIVGAAIVLVPLLWMLVASLTKGKLLSGVSLIPQPGQISLEHYQYLFSYRSQTGAPLPDFVASFLRSLAIALLNTVTVVMFTTMTAYVFARVAFKGKKPILLGLLLLQMFPSFMGMVAIFMIFRALGWLNHSLYFVTFYLAGAVPYNIYIIRGFMRNIPKSIDEAATIDGASRLTIFFRIILPLSLPIVGFIALNAFMAPWMDYMLPYQLVDMQHQTVAIFLYRLTDPLVSVYYNPLNFMAAGLILAIPIMAVNLITQRFVIYGMTAGAEKG
ncbi:MAG TPA: ABC transporter permease subunit [Rectinemataceae bacterium]|nr:ABC transporter permease subunit [Rectinemataceae bacterium]